MPCEGGEAVMPANEAPLNNIAARVSTPDLKNLCLFGEPARNQETASYISTSFRQARASVIMWIEPCRCFLATLP